MPWRKKTIEHLCLLYLILTAALIFAWLRASTHHKGSDAAGQKCDGIGEKATSCPILEAWFQSLRRGLAIAERPEQKHDEDGMKTKKTKNRPPLLLVLFTTFKTNSPHHVLAHRLVVSNWASFGRTVKPVLFARRNRQANATDPFEDFLVEWAVDRGWDVLPLESTNSFGTPLLKPMFAEVFRRYEASFYGFANGDLLFTDGLLGILSFLRSALENILVDNALLVGRRTDVQLPATDVRSFSAGSGQQQQRRRKGILEINTTAVQSAESKFNRSNLAALAAREGELREAYAVDYFIFTPASSFDWASIADVVVGRAGYDNYLVTMANRLKVNTVDLSDSLVAVHLAKPGTKNTGQLNNDTEFNVDLIGRNFPYEFGHTTNARFSLDRNNSIVSGLALNERPNRPKE